MTDKKFTDEEIINALQEMWDCSYNYEECQQHLINRQKAEIDRLKGSTIVNNIMEIQRIKRETKTETCKEFAEKLKEKRWDAECRAGYVQVVDVGSIDEVLKEMEDN